MLTNNNIPQRNSIAAVVVLYNPGPDVTENILSWSTQVAKIFAIDNSEQSNATLVKMLSGLENLDYLWLGENLGVATALNFGAERALSEGHHWLLTMDQDSEATHGMVDTMMGCLQDRRNPESVGIIAPFASDKQHVVPPDKVECSEEMTVITSGNLLNLKAYLNVGPFWDQLFIDQVDIEYCLRLNAAGFKVVRCNAAILQHNLGDISTHLHRGKTCYTTNHNSLRRYYISRNRMYVMAKYRHQFPEFCTEMRSIYRGEIESVLFFEKSKLNKLRMMLKGYLDYRRGITGKYRES
jgi:rhamnosyltransferase